MSEDALTTVQQADEGGIVDPWRDVTGVIEDSTLRAMSRDDLLDTIRGLRGALRHSEAKFASITEIGEAMGTTFNLDQLLGVIMDKITELMEAERSTLFVLDEETNELWSRVSQGIKNVEIRLEPGEGIAGWVAKTGKSINIRDAYSDPRFNPEVDARTGYQTRSILCQPIRNQAGQIIGVVQVLNRIDGPFTPEDENLLSAIASQAGIALENHKLYKSVIQTNYDLTDAKRRLEQKMSELNLLYEIERHVGRTVDLSSMMRVLTAKIADVFDAEGAAVAIKEVDHLRGYFNAPANDGWSFHERALAEGEGINAQVIETGAPYLCNTGVCGVPGAANEPFGTIIRNVMAVPLFDDNEVCIGALKVVNHQDLSAGFDEDELKVLEIIGKRISSSVVARRQAEELEKANRLATIGQMLSGVIHDLKNPIAIISGYVQLMARSDDRDKRDAYATSIKRQFEQLNTMTRELLNFARGDRTIIRRKIFVGDYFEELAELLREELSPKNVALELEIGYRKDAQIDPDKLNRAILNLARNAADSMPDGGTFRIEVDRDAEAQELVFTFADTGTGVPDEIRDNLFESFVTRGKEHGTGLGLAIVKKIVDEHEGTIEFDSTLNEGTTFTIRLPHETA